MTDTDTHDHIHDPAREQAAAAKAAVNALATSIKYFLLDLDEAGIWGAHLTEVTKKEADVFAKALARSVMSQTLQHTWTCAVDLVRDEYAGGPREARADGDAK